MKKTMYASFILAMAVFICSGSGYAGNGNGSGKGSGTCTQTGNAGIAQAILEGAPFVYEGTVVSIGSGTGMVIAMAEDNATVYGIGPVRYWDRLDVDRPAVGDVIIARGYTVDYSGIARNIAMSITIDGMEVQLRDPDTAKPLWVGGRNAGK